MPNMDAQFAKGLVGICEYPIANHGNPVKNQPRHQSDKARPTGSMMRRRSLGEGLTLASNACIEAGTMEKIAARKIVAKADNIGCIPPKL